MQQEKSADTVALLQTVDAVYAGWILNNDDLHSRLGELKGWRRAGFMGQGERRQNKR